MDKKSAIKAGLAEAFPLAVAIAAYGLSYGVLAIQANLSVAEAVAMSLLVFSGSVQMVVVAMLMAGAGLTSIFFSALLLNLRNLLYGAALAGGLASAKRGRWLLAFGVSDDPFVLGSARFKRYGPDPLYFGTVVFLFYAAWAFSSLLGAFAGNQLDPQKWGLDLAFPMTFTALLLPVLKEKPIIATATAAAIIAFLLEYLRPGNELTIILAGVAAPWVGLYIKRRGQRNA